MYWNYRIIIHCTRSRGKFASPTRRPSWCTACTGISRVVFVVPTAELLGWPNSNSNSNKAVGDAAVRLCQKPRRLPIDRRPPAGTRKLHCMREAAHYSTEPMETQYKAATPSPSAPAPPPLSSG